MFKGKTAVVTGSSRGIGAEIALAFACHGARVVVHGRDEEALASVHKRITEAGGSAWTFVADLDNFQDIEAMRHDIENQVGPTDILVANAGGSYAAGGSSSMPSAQPSPFLRSAACSSPH